MTQLAVGAVVLAVLLVGAVLGACAILGPNGWDQASAGDAAESYAVLEHVRATGSVPESASAGRSHTASRRFVTVTGVEDPSIQDTIVGAVAEARRLHSTKPVVVTFYAGTVVKDRSGGARFPDGRRKLRIETIP
jgi:hypothetical protein